MDQISCPSCGESYQIDDTYRGRSFECHCGTIVHVPAGAGPGAPPPPPPPPPLYQPGPAPSSDGTTALVLGILGIVLCPLLAPFAWASGSGARRRAMAQGLAPSGMATAGWVLGIVGTIIILFWVALGLIFLLAGAAAVSHGGM